MLFRIRSKKAKWWRILSRQDKGAFACVVSRIQKPRKLGIKLSLSEWLASTGIYCPCQFHLFVWLVGLWVDRASL